MDRQQSLLLVASGMAVGWMLNAWYDTRNRRKRYSFATQPSSTPSSLPSHIRNEQLSRHQLFFGSEKLDKLKQCRVCVVGVGGVGSHTAHMLARSGICFVRIIDFDQVTVSSLNRHACATLRDVGRSKVDCLREFLEQICPDPRHLQIEAVNEMLTSSTTHLLDDDFDMIVDCIDDIPTKAALIAHCISSNIPVLSCMGAGGKADPTRLCLSDLKSAARDPLATKLRQSLKKYDTLDPSFLENMDRLTILYSSEKVVAKLADFTESQKASGNVHQYGAVDGMRIRILPVLGTLPASMGQALAGYCLTTLAGQPFQPVTGERVGRNAKHSVYQKFRNREVALSKDIRSLMNESDSSSVVPTESEFGTGELVTLYNGDDHSNKSKTVWIGNVQVDSYDDMDYLFEIWRNRCGVTGARLGTSLQLVRWDLSRPSTCDNVVLVSNNIVKNFSHQSIDSYKASLDNKVVQTIQQRLANCRLDR